MFNAKARRNRYAPLLLGHGLEIGALDSPMPAPLASSVLYSDVLSPAQIDEQCPGGRYPDIVSDSEHYPGVASQSFDFVVANHVLEHVTDVLQALLEWHRILRPGGVILLSIPDKRYTFDYRRRRTLLAHIESDHRSTSPPEIRNECHLLDWAEHVERLVPGSEAFASWIAEQKGHGFAVHNHVWVMQDLLNILGHLRSTYRVYFGLECWSNTSPFGDEFTLLLRKCTSPLSSSSLWRFHLAMVSALLAHPAHEIWSRIRRTLGKWLRRSPVS